MNKGFLFHENIEMKEKYFSFTHENGLKILVFPKKMSSLYAIYATNFGSVNNRFMRGGREILLPDGVAHFLEHKMFEGKDGKIAFELYAQYGASANAYTSALNTAYLFSATSEYDRCLGVLLDFVNNPFFTEENIRKEQGIIGQEIGMYDDHPFSRLYYATLSLMYKDHPIRKNICGTVQSISQITPDILYDCYNSFYRPENMVLAVCGDITPERVLGAVNAAHFNEDLEQVQKLPCGNSAGLAGKHSEFEMEIAKPLISIGIKDTHIPLNPKEKLKKALSTEMLCEILFGKSSDFYNRKYDAGEISAIFSADYDEYSDCAHILFFDEGGDEKKLYDSIFSEIDKNRKNPFSKDEFERVRRVKYSDNIRSFDSTDDIANNMMRSYFRGYDIFEEATILSSISYDDVLSCLDSFSEDLSVSVKINTAKTRRKS